MLSPQRLLWSLLFVLAVGVGTSATPAPDQDRPGASAIAVTDFSGQDSSLGRFISETLLTDLARSPVLQLVERAEIRRALTELKLQSSGLSEPEQVRNLGSLVGADRLVVGSYMVHDEQIIINARLLDVQTAGLVPGGACNVSGDRRNLLDVAHRLAQRFHQRVTGQALALEDETEEPISGARIETKPAAVSVERQTPPSDLDRLRTAGIVPPDTRGSSTLTESDLVALIRRIAPRLALQTPAALRPAAAGEPVMRIRVLTALVKAVAPPDPSTVSRPESAALRLPDAADVPAWGRPFAAMALEQGLWPPDRPLHPREYATWTFVATLLAPLPALERRPTPARRSVGHAASTDNESYTGLIVDSRGLGVWRSMSPKLLRPDGSEVWGTVTVDPDYVIEHGIVAYAHTLEEARGLDRAGGHPLVVRATGCAEGNFSSDPTISSEDAERILAANAESGFLRKFHVIFVVDEGH